MVDMYGTPYTQACTWWNAIGCLITKPRKKDWNETQKRIIEFRRMAIYFDVDPNYRGKHLQLQFTVEDEGVFTTPWSATITYGRSTDEWPENVCAENPHKYDTEKDAAVPTADKPDF